MWTASAKHARSQLRETWPIHPSWPLPASASTSATRPSSTASSSAIAPGERLSPGRPQRRRQVDPAAHPGRRADRRRRHALRPARRHRRAPCRRSRISPATPASPHYVAAALADALGPADYRVAAILDRDEARRRSASRPSCRAARRAARRSPARWSPSPTSCCSTSRPTISTCRPSNGWRPSSSAWRGAYVLVSHDRRFLVEPRRAPCCGSTAASCAGSTRATTSSRHGRPTSSSARRPSGTSSTG